MAKADQETIIVINDAESTANVWSNSPTMMKRLKEKDGWYEQSGGVTVDLPKKSVIIK